MPVVYPQYGPGLPGDPSLDGLRQLGSLSATRSGSRGPLNDHRQEGADDWSLPQPPPATPPNEVPIALQMLQSLKMAPSIMTKLKGPAALQSSDQESRPV